MGNTLRNNSLSLINDFIYNPRSYSFEMAVKTLCYNSRLSFGAEKVIAQQSLRVESINVFYLRGTEIGGILNENGRYILKTERLALAGLNAPLPTPYAELLMDRKKESDFAMAQFLNIFNTRLLGISYRISEKRHACLKPENYMMTKILSCFFGDEYENFNIRLSKLGYIFWLKEKSISGLETILRYLLPLNVHIEPVTLMKLQNKHICKLGYMKLGVDSEIGRYFYVINFKIAIHLSGCSHRYVTSFINDIYYISKLNQLISKYFVHMCHYEMFIKPNDAPSLTFSNFVLGRISWLAGSCTDEVKISHISS